MRRLESARELLDGPLDGATLAGNLRDLERVNRVLGGTGLSWRAVEHVWRSRTAKRAVSLLDVGTGGADIPVALSRRAARSGMALRIEAVDVRPEIVAAARRRASRGTGITVSHVPRDRLPYPDDAFDIVHASLVLHHLDTGEARGFLAEMARVAGAAVLVNDLARARRWWVGAWLLSRLLSRNRYTRHDAPLSVRRAWQPAEVIDLAESVGLRAETAFRDRLRHRYALVLRPPTP